MALAIFTALLAVLFSVSPGLAHECGSYKENAKLDQLIQGNFKDGVYQTKILDCKGYCVAAKYTPLDGYFTGEAIREHFERSYGAPDAYIEESAQNLIQYCIRSTGPGGGMKDQAPLGILFETGKADIMPQAEAALQEVANLLKADSGVQMRVVGHTDSKGGLAGNIGLSEKRAAAVAKALTEKYGVEAGRLHPAWVGPLEPVADNNSEDGRAANRRVELIKPTREAGGAIGELVTLAPVTQPGTTDVKYAVFVRFERDKPVKVVNYTIARQTPITPPLQRREGDKSIY
jgi:outer membrane protein OmpA-like peptidoglycan-associated protein